MYVNDVRHSERTWGSRGQQARFEGQPVTLMNGTVERKHFLTNRSRRVVPSVGQVMWERFHA